MSKRRKAAGARHVTPDGRHIPVQLPEPKAGTIAPTHFGNTANALEPRVAVHPQAPKDATAGSNAGAAANLFEGRVVQQN